MLRNSHWTLVTLDPKALTVNHYNSINGKVKDGESIRFVFDFIKAFILFESQKSNKSISFDEWKFISNSNIPQQDNNFDCGVFVCTYAKFLCLKINFNFQQTDMQEIRSLMHSEMLNMELIKDNKLFISSS
jgi:Ulp1 family protease